METLPLYGRESEIRALNELIDGLGTRGAAIVVRGEAGIGKSCLVDALGRTALARAMSVLRTTGVPSEANLPFAGLHQLLHPRIAELGTLPSPQRAALEAAFGMTADAAPDLFLIALATLNLLGDVAERAPLLLVIEDAQWLDRSTSQVLAFVARRLSMERILLLLVIRDGIDSVFDTAGLDELRVEPLADASAAELLDAHAPDLVPSVRERLLRAAAGNPLALIELAGHHWRAREEWRSRITSRSRSGSRRPSRPGSGASSADGEGSCSSPPRTVECPCPKSWTRRGRSRDGQSTQTRSRSACRPTWRRSRTTVCASGTRWSGSAVYQSASPGNAEAVHAMLAAMLDGEPRDRAAWHRASGRPPARTRPSRSNSTRWPTKPGVAASLASAVSGARSDAARARATTRDRTAGRLLRRRRVRAVELGRLDVVAAGSWVRLNSPAARPHRQRPTSPGCAR